MSRSPPPTAFGTARLTLRATRWTDAPALFRNYTGRRDASLYLQRLPHLSVEHTLSATAHWGWEGRFVWSIRAAPSDEAVGVFIMDLDGREAVVHYGIAPELWGRGYLTEAGLAVMDWLKGPDGVDLVSTICDVEHGASLRVLEKIGLIRAGLLPKHAVFPMMPDKRDCWRYEWRRPAEA